MSSQQKSSSVRGDDSDWFSRLTVDVDLSAPGTHTQHRELAPSTLEIESVKVGLGAISRAANEFGKATIVTRGDAAYSRIQACYVSNDSHAYLIFEEDGEGFGGGFYLFSGGRQWHGSRFCSKLPLNSERIQTKSGLRLGLSRNDVEAILGRPSKASPNTLTYTLEVTKKASPSELARSRAQNPSLSDREIREDFGFYYVTSDVAAKFSASKLVYLAVTKYESYP
jgi:hypothetical protein